MLRAQKKRKKSLENKKPPNKRWGRSVLDRFFDLCKLVKFGSSVILSKLKIMRARKIFECASNPPFWLTWDVLETLQAEHSLRVEYGYDAESLEC